MHMHANQSQQITYTLNPVTKLENPQTPKSEDPRWGVCSPDTLKIAVAGHRETERERERASANPSRSPQEPNRNSDFLALRGFVCGGAG